MPLVLTMLRHRLRIELSARNAYQPDGGIYAESGNGYYTFTPTVGISWLHAGWNISADIIYTIATKDTDTIPKR